MIIFKHQKDKNLFFQLHPILIMILGDAADYAERSFKKDLVITQTVSTPEEDRRLNRQSPAHQEKRAADIGILNLIPEQIKELCSYLNNHPSYLKYHYDRISGGRILAYDHVGSARHIHIAIHKRYAR